MALLRCALGLSLAVLLPLTALADQAQIRGRITRIDLKKKEIVVQQGLGGARGQAVKLHVNADTQVFMAGRPAQLSDLDIGKRVKVIYEDEDGRCVAQSIRAGELQRAIGRLMEAAASSGISLPGGIGGARRPGAVEPAEPGDVPPVPGEPAPAPPEPGDAAPPPPAPVAPPAAARNVVVGRVKTISVKERSVVVRTVGRDGEETEMTIVIPAKVSIKKGEDLLDLSTLKAGDTVIIKTEKQQGRLSAVSVELGARKPQAAPPGAPEDPEAVPAVPPARHNRPRTISRLREILQMADQVLQQMEQDGRRQQDDQGP